MIKKCLYCLWGLVFPSLVVREGERSEGELFFKLVAA